jgi:hypothetical protein
MRKLGCMTKEQPPEFSSGYLALDDADDRPLIIDQPEENLDPKSIFDELIGLFVRAKHKRQVIMVTHNANLVIAAPNPARADIRADRAQLLLEPWSVQAALGRRRGGQRLTDSERSEIRRCTRDPDCLRWPRGTDE